MRSHLGMRSGIRARDQGRGSCWCNHKLQEATDSAGTTRGTTTPRGAPLFLPRMGDHTYQPCTLRGNAIATGSTHASHRGAGELSAPINCTEPKLEMAASSSGSFSLSQMWCTQLRPIVHARKRSVSSAYEAWGGAGTRERVHLCRAGQSSGWRTPQNASILASDV